MSASSNSPIDFHRGEALWRFANTYPSLMLTILEGAQNAIDAGADRIMIGINLKSRTVITVDNGSGVFKDRFEEALASVARGVKDPKSLGRFGLGLISPLNKCRRFTFTSNPIGGRTLCWTFIGDELRKQHHQTVIPCQQLSAFPQLPKWLRGYAVDQFDTQWRSQLMLIGVTKDRVTSLVDLDELESSLRQKFSQPMRQGDVVIRLVLVDEAGRAQDRIVNPVIYGGEKLPVVTYRDDEAAEAGEVVFELYRAPKLGGSRKGDVVIMKLGDNYPVTIREFERQAWGGRLRDLIKEPVAVLASGYFEGVIRCKGIDLAPERTKFEYNEALQDLYLVICTWYENYGKDYFDDEQTLSREERYQDLGTRSQQRLRDFFLNRPEFSRLWDGLKELISYGRVGEGHTESERAPIGSDEDTTVRSGQGGAGINRPKDSLEGSAAGDSSSRKPKDRPGDVPTGASGPHGQRRKLVRGDSQGLWFAYSWLEGSTRLWEFDFQDGTLTFNVRHPIWVSLDESNGKRTARNDRWIMELQEYLALEVLVLIATFRSEEELEAYRHLLDTKIRPYVDLHIINRRAGK